MDSYMADKLPFRSQAGAASSMSGPEGDIPGWTPFTQGEAPAGKVFSEGELPVIATHGGSGFSEGFSPSAMNPPLPAPGSDTGFPLPPSGNRR
jgi:hypothetical protein